MSDDFMEEEFERDRNRAFQFRALMEQECPWDVISREFPDVVRVELVVSVIADAAGKLSRRVEIYEKNGSQISFRSPCWLDEEMSDKEALAEMSRLAVSEIRRELFISQKG